MNARVSAYLRINIFKTKKQDRFTPFKSVLTIKWLIYLGLTILPLIKLLVANQQKNNRRNLNNRYSGNYKFNFILYMPSKIRKK